MNDTLSQLYSSIYLSVGQVDDSLIQRVEVGNIVLRWLSFRLEQVRQSEQSVAILKSATITLESGEHEATLTDLEDDFVVPMWAEFRSYNILQNEVWTFLPTVHQAMLPKSRNLGQYACSFRGSNAREVIVDTSLCGNEVLSPFNQIRVWYLPTVPLPSTESETLALPNNLVNMVWLDSLPAVLRVMSTNAAKQLKNTPELADQMKEWDKNYAHYMGERAEWEVMFLKWCRESRGAHRPRRRGDILVNRQSGTMLPMFVRTGGS